MVIYLDLLWFLNFSLDTLLLFIVSITLKRNTKFFRLILGGLVGSLSTFIVFFKINTLILFILKIILSILIIIIAFNLGNKKYFINNLFYFYTTSILLGGFVYYLNNNYNSLSTLTLNYILIILLSPIILLIYYKQSKELKMNYNYYYEISICFNNNKIIKTNAFLDTGNRLKDPYSHKPIILLSKKLLDNNINIRSPILVPYNTLNHHSLLPCIKPKYIIINNQKLDKYLIGISEEEFGFDGINCILNNELLKENI